MYLAKCIELGWAYIYCFGEKTRLLGESLVTPVLIRWLCNLAFQLFIVSSWFLAFIFRFIASPFELLIKRFSNLKCNISEVLFVADMSIICSAEISNDLLCWMYLTCRMTFVGRLKQ